MFIRSFFASLFSIICVLLSGCTDNLKSALGSAEAFIDHNNGIDISAEYIRSIPYSSSLVTINNAHPILMVLSFAEKKTNSDVYRLTWLAGDKNIIITENGRIVQTTGFPHNLEGLTSVKSVVPLPHTRQNWTSVYDWSPGFRYGFTASVRSTSLGEVIIKTDSWTQTTEHIKEDLYFNALDYTFSNQFWVAPKTHDHKAYVIKSIQYLGPKMHKVEMLMVKPFLEPTSNTKTNTVTPSKDSTS